MLPEAIRSSLFTRRQVMQLTEVDNSSLNYWMREGLLRPVEGGSGKGSHRRFDFVQLNIAAVYGELRRFGVNIAALRSLANLLQSAAQLGRSAQLDISNYTTAASLADALARFRRGDTVLVEPNWLKQEPEEMLPAQRSAWLDEKRAAIDEADLVKHFLRFELDYDSLEAVLAAAELIGPGRCIEATIYVDLVADILRPGYSEEVTWLLGLRDDGSWELESGSEGRFFENIYGRKAGDFGSGIFIPLGAILRKLWTLKTPEQLRRERDAEWVQARLTDAGFQVEVFPAEDDERPMTVRYDHPITHEQIEEVLSRKPWMQRKESGA